MIFDNHRLDIEMSFCYDTVVFQNIKIEFNTNISEKYIDNSDTHKLVLGEIIFPYIFPLNVNISLLLF